MYTDYLHSHPQAQSADIKLESGLHCLPLVNIPFIVTAMI